MSQIYTSWWQQKVLFYPANRWLPSLLMKIVMNVKRVGGSGSFLSTLFCYAFLKFFLKYFFCQLTLTRPACWWKLWWMFGALAGVPLVTTNRVGSGMCSLRSFCVYLNRCEYVLNDKYLHSTTNRMGLRMRSLRLASILILYLIL